MTVKTFSFQAIFFLSLPAATNETFGLLAIFVLSIEQLKRLRVDKIISGVPVTAIKAAFPFCLFLRQVELNGRLVLGG
jgi:hypothetical protein